MQKNHVLDLWGDSSPLCLRTRNACKVFYAAGVLKCYNKMEYSEKSSQLVTMLMLRTQCQRSRLYAHILCKQYFRWKTATRYNCGNLATFMFENFIRKKLSKIYLSKPLFGYSKSRRLLLLPFFLYKQMTLTLSFVWTNPCSLHPCN